MLKPKMIRLIGVVAAAGAGLLFFQNATDATAYTSTDFSKNEIADFLLPDMCIDKNGAQTFQNPLNSNASAPECIRRRQMLPGDFFPYFRTDYIHKDNKFFMAEDPTYNPHSNRLFIFPLSRAYDVTDQDGNRSTTILHWQTSPIDDKGDRDRFKSVHEFYDTIGVLSIRNGFGSLLGGLGMPKMTEERVKAFNKTDPCVVEKKCKSRDDWMVSYNMSSGKGLYDFKKAERPSDEGYNNDGVALFELAWSFPQRKTGDGFKAPVVGKALYEVLPKRTQVLQVNDNNEPIFDRADLKIPAAKSIGILANVGRFRFGPGENYGKSNAKMNNYMEALVHFGFAKTNKFGDGPARPYSEDVDFDGRQYTNNPSVSERTYLTRELGYNTRWELWHGTNIARENWDDDERSGIRAYRGQNCSEPANIAVGGDLVAADVQDDNNGGRILKGERFRKVTPHFAAGNVLTLISSLPDSAKTGKSKGLPYYAQYFYTLDSSGVWHRLRWVMTGCHDTSNVKTNYENNYINKGSVVFSSKDKVKVFPEKVTNTKPRCDLLNLLVRKGDQKRCRN